MGERPRRSVWRRLRRLTVFILVGYLIVLGVMLALENRLLYFPSRFPGDWHEPRDLDKQDVTLVAADGTSIHAWWCPRPGATGALLHCHGNGGNLSHRAGVYAALQREQNVSVLGFDYPGYGRSGGKPSEAGCYAAAEAAYEWLTIRQQVPPERLILFGESLGGGPATELATRRPYRALVLFSTFTSAPDVGRDHYPLLPVRLLMRNRFDNIRKVPELTRPVFIAHGDADSLISPDHARRLFDAVRAPVALHLDPGRGHTHAMTPAFHAALRDFLQENAPL
ncbi:MAG: alpha/beta hydrolase [Gemmataceae bacterium]